MAISSSDIPLNKQHSFINLRSIWVWRESQPLKTGLTTKNLKNISQASFSFMTSVQMQGHTMKKVVSFPQSYMEVVKCVVTFLTCVIFPLDYQKAQIDYVKKKKTQKCHGMAFPGKTTYEVQMCHHKHSSELQEHCPVSTRCQTKQKS